MISFRKRLALGHLAAIVAVLTITAFSAYWGLSKVVHGQLDAAILALAETEVAMLAKDRGPVGVHDVAPGPQPPSLTRLDRLVQIVDANGRVLARSRNLGQARLPTSPALLARLAQGQAAFETLPEFGEEPMRMVSLPAQGPDGPVAIQVAGSLDDVKNVMEAASVLFIVMALALVAAVGAAGALLTRRAFGAIDAIVHQARRIGEASLSARLSHPGTHDEIGRLVDTLNEMLGRLERGFEFQRRFTADASHELRSPLSRLRTELEVTLRRPRDATEYVEALHSCIEEVERMTLLVEELLMLARLDAGQDRRSNEAVSLNPIAEEAIRRLWPVARERQVQIALDPSPPVSAKVARGSASLVLANLLDNAVKFSPPGGKVTVRLDTDGAEAVMSVSDTGPGIGADEFPHLFERFYRGSGARAASAPGVGLGLALSRAIVHSNEGRIEAANSPAGGARFTVRFPLAA